MAKKIVYYQGRKYIRLRPNQELKIKMFPRLHNLDSKRTGPQLIIRGRLYNYIPIKKYKR